MVYKVYPALSKQEEAKRMKLSQQVKASLLLKSVSPLLNYVAVPTSTFPRELYNLKPGSESFSKQEMSLKRLGLVTRMGGAVSYIDPDTGRTMNVPDHPAVLRELQDCGFKILPPEEAADINKEQHDYYNSEKFYRSRISPYVYDKIDSFEKTLGPLKIGDGVCSRSLCRYYAMSLTHEIDNSNLKPDENERQILEMAYNGFNYMNQCEGGETLQNFVFHALDENGFLDEKYLRPQEIIFKTAQDDNIEQ